MHLARQVEQCLGANAEVCVLEHLDGRRTNIAVPGGAQQRQGAAADVGLGVLQQRAQRRLPAPRLLHLQQAERIAHFVGIAARQLRS